MGGLWPDECANNDYPGLDDIMCLACSPEQPKYTDIENKIIRICDSLLKLYYGNDNLNEPTEKFEQCGAWSSPDTTLDPVDTTDESKGFVLNEGSAELIFPANEYPDAQEFYNNFAQASIPFMSDFSIQAVPDLDENGNPNICYKNATALST